MLKRIPVSSLIGLIFIGILAVNRLVDSQGEERFAWAAE